ncbi:hypothetical protein GUJ93_ZPchr0004g39704 [Zizania palustris]|uniref:Major facilitator superfamily (MFS) profile domain-containing protein n=1 Tax=Zizania palustris TaxID=103762 RepID=A0A8J5SZU7_ZIZPA|nr:hypothetical protein GUJ93_ZPchr0004g39704 [Zizania palustris]
MDDRLLPSPERVLRAQLCRDMWHVLVQWQGMPSSDATFTPKSLQFALSTILVLQHYLARSNNQMILNKAISLRGCRFFTPIEGNKLICLRAVPGYISYNFVIGAYSYWGPKAGRDIYHMASADLMFGGITIVCGIFGTLAGGFILDKIDSTISNAFKLLSSATFLGAIFCFGAFCFKSLYGFIPFFSVGELLVFATQAPVNYVCLHCVKPSLRPLSMAMSTVSIHIFGDVPSSPLVGLLQDKIHNWRSTALTLTSILFIAAVFWFIGIFVQSVDRFNEQSGVPVVERSNLRPLLDENEDTRTS